MNQEYQRLLKRYERKFTPVIYRAIKEQIDEYLKTRSLDSIKQDPILQALDKLYVESGSAWAFRVDKEIRRQLNLPRIGTGFSRQIAKLIRDQYRVDMLNMSKEITDTTKKRIRNILIEGVDSSLTVDETAKLIQENGVTQARARVIARTETVKAANGAALANAEDKGYVYQKQWFAVMDKRTRHDHRKLDGQTIDKEDAFSIVDKNGITQRMRYPGDDSLGASPAEVINCRCSMLLIAK